MLYELRRYDVAAGKLPALVDRFGSFVVPKWKDYGFRLIGFWLPIPLGVAAYLRLLKTVHGWQAEQPAAGTIQSEVKANPGEVRA